jgi:hypothetical protein
MRRKRDTYNRLAHQLGIRADERHAIPELWELALLRHELNVELWEVYCGKQTT